jgi:hypothetical protein
LRETFTVREAIVDEYLQSTGHAHHSLQKGLKILYGEAITPLPYRERL